MTKSKIYPSQRAFSAVRKLARDAAKNDNWLCPELDGLLDSEKDGDIGMAHRDSWQQTCHWEHYYGRPINELVEQQTRRLARRYGPLEFEERYYGLYDPLVDAFWEEWESHVGFWTAVEEARNSAPAI